MKNKHTCKTLKIDIGQVLVNKMAYNETRISKHGKRA